MAEFVVDFYSEHDGVKCEEVVRCKDCEHCHEHNMRAYGGDRDRDRLLCHRFSMSSGAGWPVDAEGFCKWGVRRAE